MRGGNVTTLDTLKYPIKSIGFEGEFHPKLMGAVKVGGDSQLEEIKVDEILLTNPGCSMYSETMSNKTDESNLFNPVEFKQLFMCDDTDLDRDNIVDKYVRLFLMNCRSTMSLLSNDETLPDSIVVINHDEEETLPYGINLDGKPNITINLNNYDLIYKDPIIYYVKKIHRFPIVIQFSIGFDKSENMKILKNISEICHQLCMPLETFFCKNIKKDTINDEEIDDKFKSYFNYAITSFVSMMSNYYATSSGKFSIGALLRHTPDDILMVLCNNNLKHVEMMKDKLHILIYDAVVALFPGFIIHSEKKIIIIEEEDVNASINAYLNDTIDETGRSNFYSSAFYKISDGIVIEDRMCRVNEKSLKSSVVTVKHDVSGGTKSRKIKIYKKSRKIKKYKKSRKTKRQC